MRPEGGRHPLSRVGRRQASLARLTGAPVLMVFAYRSADYRHQVLEISPPVPMEGDTATAFERCVAAMDAAITAHPAEWDFWFEPGDLASLGLLSDAQQPVAKADDHAAQGPAALSRLRPRFVVAAEGASPAGTGTGR